jgi:UTP--glucose-1-phosphate uridylyltransferase
MEITKVVIPAAGLGTRFLPYTKTVPKEMLPILGKPAIHYSVEEAINSGIEHVLFITNRSKDLIGNYFDSNPELDLFLQDKNKLADLKGINQLIKSAHFSYIRQSEPLGLGHAVLMAKPFLGKEYFGIALPDDIIMNKRPALDQLIRIARQEKSTVIAVQEVPHDQVSNYGIVRIKKQITPNLFHVDSLVEKPSIKDAPSNLAIVGRYVVSHKIFTSLEEISGYATQELQLTDALSHMLQHNEKVFAYKIEGTRYDVGTPRGWLKTMVDLGLQDPMYKDDIMQLVQQHSGNFYIPDAPNQNKITL